MKSVLILLAVVGIIGAAVNINEIIKEPSTKGWGVGLGFLAFVGFGLWSILLET